MSEKFQLNFPDFSLKIPTVVDGWNFEENSRVVDTHSWGSSAIFGSTLVFHSKNVSLVKKALTQFPLKSETPSTEFSVSFPRIFGEFFWDFGSLVVLPKLCFFIYIRTIMIFWKVYLCQNPSCCEALPQLFSAKLQTSHSRDRKCIHNDKSFLTRQNRKCVFFVKPHVQNLRQSCKKNAVNHFLVQLDGQNRFSTWKRHDDGNFRENSYLNLYCRVWRHRTRQE